jgi:hypothetical protein
MNQILNFLLDEEARHIDIVAPPEKPRRNIFQNESEADSTEMAEEIWARAIDKLEEKPTCKH